MWTEWKLINTCLSNLIISFEWFSESKTSSRIVKCKRIAANKLSNSNGIKGKPVRNRDKKFNCKHSRFKKSFNNS